MCSKNPELHFINTQQVMYTRVDYFDIYFQTSGCLLE